jgi:hypothetical protein
MKNRKAVIITIVIVAIIMLAVASWLIYKRFFKKDSTDEDVKDETMPDWSTNNSTTPTYSQTTFGTSFPIKKGARGSEVEKIQAAINKKCGAGLTTDGDFGPRTESALLSCYNTKEVSSALFTQMGFDLGGSPAVPTGFSRGNKVYLKGSSAGIYSFPEAKGQWIVGNVTKSILGTNPFGTWVGKANSSFDKVLVVGYIGKDGKPVVLSPAKEFFVSRLLISKSAY